MARMAPKLAKLEIFIPINFYDKIFTVGIKTKNLPSTTRLDLWSFFKGVL